MQFNITFKTIFEYILKKVVLYMQIHFVTTEKTTRIASRASYYIYLCNIILKQFKRNLIVLRSKNLCKIKKIKPEH